MAISKQAIELIKHYESLHDGDLKTIGIQPKMDPLGIWTIGWGHVIIDPITGKFVKGKENYNKALSLYPNLDIKGAEFLLTHDLLAYESEVRKNVKVSLDDDQIGALVAFAYNIGMDAFKKSSALLQINAGNIVEGGKRMLLWNKGTLDGTKVVLKGLTFRRMSEQNLLVNKTLVFYN